MANTFAFCLIGEMDHLWFHHIILFSSERFSETLNKSSREPLPIPSPTHSSSSFQEEKISMAESPVLHHHQDSSNSSFITDDDLVNQEEVKETCEQCKRPMRTDLCKGRNRSHSSSPLEQSRGNKRRNSGSVSSRKLQKSMSCRDLEMEEVKGFMDLGFVFAKEHLNKRIMSVVPGLQRLGFSRNREKKGDGEETEEEEKRGVMRPYLSEAWLIRRPDSPLLNLRMPRVYAAADMKKHLRSWARTVASVVQQECY